MQEQGALLRHDLKASIEALKPSLSAALGQFGDDFHVDASDGIGRKTELPWVRFCSESRSPNPTEGFHAVLHFSTDGSAVHVMVGCGSSKFHKGTSESLPDSELDAQTAWARAVVNERLGTLEPFLDPPNFGATRPLPKSFERASSRADGSSWRNRPVAHATGFRPIAPVRGDCRSEGVRPERAFVSRD